MYQQIQDLLDKIGSKPERPKEPKFPAGANSDAIRVYADTFKEFEDKLDGFKAEQMMYLAKKTEIEHEIAVLITHKSGLSSIPMQYRGKVWNLAHSKTDNHYDAYLFLCELVEIFE
jgi:hypothetical protein